MDRIQSFSVDHDFIEPGIYVSRIDGDITTYDLRTRKPNCGSYMDNITMHTVEHMLATYFRNSDIGYILLMCQRIPYPRRRRNAAGILFTVSL